MQDSLKPVVGSGIIYLREWITDLCSGVIRNVTLSACWAPIHSADQKCIQEKTDFRSPSIACWVYVTKDVSGFLHDLQFIQETHDYTKLRPVWFDSCLCVSSYQWAENSKLAINEWGDTGRTPLQSHQHRRQKARHPSDDWGWNEHYCNQKEVLLEL